MSEKQVTLKQVTLGLQRLFTGQRYRIRGERPGGGSVDDEFFAFNEADALEQARQTYPADVINGMTFRAELVARRKKNSRKKNGGTWHAPEPDEAAVDEQEEETPTLSMGQ